MRLSNIGNGKRGKQQLAITTQLIDVLRQVNLDTSWKNGSSKFSKNRTGCMRAQTKLSNLMTEQDLDKLFSKSKEKAKLKTEIVIMDDVCQRTPLHRDFTNIKFLQLDDEYDRMLTGIPLAFNHKENQPSSDYSDLTIKFKKDYVVGKVIGEGAYASVRVAIYRPDNKKIAIKAYEKVKIRDHQRKKTVRREIKILQIVTHPNIVKIYDVVETNNHVNIIMEYLPGISLGTSLKQQSNHRFSEQHCRKIIRELAEALKYLHDRNIAHRDIKLENVILDDQLSPKLIDFGFSTCIERNKKMKIFCGTPSYMAPQIIQKKEYRGEGADIWALGVMMFVMLTGYFPYKGATDDQLYQKINLADYPKQEICQFKKASHMLSKMFIINAEERITAEGILNHAWLNELVSPPVEALRRTRNDPSELRKMLNNSKEKSPDIYQEKRSRSNKPVLDSQRQKGLLKTTKDLAGKLASAIYRPKFERTLIDPTRDESSSRKERKQNHQRRMAELVKLQLKRRSEEKTKCKSHRI